MKRREFISMLGSVAAILPLAARAQQQPRPVIGFLDGQTFDSYLMTAFRQTLQDTGYIEGRNVEIYFRSADVRTDRLVTLAGDIVGRRVAVIVTAGGGAAALAAYCNHNDSNCLRNRRRSSHIWPSHEPQSAGRQRNRGVHFSAGAGGKADQAGKPLKIGYSMSLTGGLAANGRSALLAHKIWEEGTNSTGGLLGRPVKLIYYDDKSSPTEVPPIYTKLLDFGKVDLVVAAYGTVLTAVAMPIVIQRKKAFIGLLGLAVNSEFNYSNYFAMIPSGLDAKTAFTRGFFDVALIQNPSLQTVAILAADQNFSRNAADGARETIKQSGLKLVYERTYPPTSVDFAPIVRAVAAANPDLVVVCSYPSDSVGMVRAVNELGFKPKRSAVPWSDCSPPPSRHSLDRCSMVSSITSFGFPCIKYSFPGWTISFHVIKRERRQKGSIHWKTIWRPGHTLSFRCCNRRRRSPLMMPSSAITSARMRSQQSWEELSSGPKENGRTRAFSRCNFRTSKRHDIARFRDMSTQVVVAPAENAFGEIIYPYERV
jgi:branched-chain amino acid transport system substrate-binding protein